MISLDTNVLVRFLVLDDPAQTPKAVELIERAVQAQQRVFVSDIVLCETVWVLRSAYRATKRDIVATFRRLLADETFAVRNPIALERAIERYARARGDFADYLIGEAGAAAGAQTTYTFERALRDEPDFTLLA